MAGGKTHWNCGHERTPENTSPGTRAGTCRSCRNAKKRAGYDTADRHMEYRLTYLPRQIEATRHKLTMLENEARRYGMLHLLEGQP